MMLEADDRSFEHQVVRHPGAVLVDFSAAWCGPCKKLEPILREIAHDFDGRVSVVKVDVDRAPAVAARYAVLSVPTLLLFADGEVRNQWTGLQPKRVLVEGLERVLSGLPP